MIFNSYEFVDGPPHLDKQKQKEDKEKRDIIESKSFTVIELDFKDGRYLQNMSLIEKEVAKLRDYFD